MESVTKSSNYQSSNGSGAGNNNNDIGKSSSSKQQQQQQQQLASTNYVNVVPIQYQRRKYSQPIDYQTRLVYGDYSQQQGANSRGEYSLSSTPVPLQGQQDTDSLANSIVSGAISPVPNANSATMQRVISTNQICLDGNGNAAAAASMQQLQVQQQQQDDQQQSSSSFSINNNSNNNYNTPNSAPAAGVAYASSNVPPVTVPRPMQKVIPTVVYLMSRIAVHMEIEGTSLCPAQVMLAAALGCEELGISNKLLAQSVFGLWMLSPLLEIQLKPHHRPYAVRVAWSKLIEQYSNGNGMTRKNDDPMITLRRNVFYPRKEEEKLKDARILELLYEEARYNVLYGRYIMEPAHSIMLGGIQARIECGPYNANLHTTSYFRENQSRFLPAHVAKNTNWSWLPISRRTSAEVKLLEQFKRVPTSATTRKLMRKYLEFCWALPFYGAAFFHGQVEQPVRGLMSLLAQKDKPVLIAINERGIFIIDHAESTLLLGLRYEEFSWDFAKPNNPDDPECLPCIFLEFDAVENGISVTKLIQVFSKQAAMMDALISHFTEQIKRRKESNASVENTPQMPALDPENDEPNPIQNSGNGVLCNKLSKLITITFEGGRCIGQMGSLSISY
ncbi:FERM domain-containing protein 8 [Culicoides brevitarsis]|uniref:FERM domain-containing protein 8 n=1 Tax=Culicoides brevitarsis TaxID=469753 RepID=UPI00307C869F